MKRWFKDDIFHAILRNAGWLVSSKGAGVVLGLVSLAAAGRGLGVSEFGVLTLVHAYALAVNALIQFQSWQFVIRYGAPALERSDVPRLRNILSFSLGLDLTSGAAGMVVAMAALPFIGPMVGMEARHIPLALLYCTLIPFMAAATPTGLLRLLDRFDLLAIQAIVAPFLRAAGALVAFLLGAPFWAYLLAWYAATLLGDCSMWVMAWRELRRRKYHGGVRPRLRQVTADLPGAWGFVWTTNLNSALGANWSALSSLVVGAILGPAAAGLYRVALTIVDSAGKPADLLARAFYPEVARLRAGGAGRRRLWALALRAASLGAGVAALLALVAILFGRGLIVGFVGPEFEPAYEILVLMILALFFTMTGFPLESMLYTFGHAGASLVARASATILYLLTLAAFCLWFGVRGAGAAQIVGAAALMAATGLAALITARRDRRAGPAGAATGNPDKGKTRSPAGPGA